MRTAAGRTANAVGWWRRLAACLDTLMNRLLLMTCDAPAHRLELVPVRQTARRTRHIVRRRQGRFLSRRMRTLLLLAVLCLPLYECSALAADSSARLSTVPAPNTTHRREALPAAQAPEEHLRMEEKTITGTVVAVTKRSLSLEYQRDSTESYEMLLPFGPHMRFERLHDPKELKRGDTVTVGYQQAYRDNADKDKSETLVKTIVTSISLMKSGTQSLATTGGPSQ